MRRIFILLFILMNSMIYAQLPDCSQPEFYAAGTAGDQWGRVIMKFKLESPTGPVSYYGSTAETVTMEPGPFMPNSSENPNPMGFAISDFGEGPQFYTSTMSFGDDIFELSHYDGTHWNLVMSDVYTHQMGGRGEHLYLQTHKIMGYIDTDRIYHFNGHDMEMIWESSGDQERLVAADIAVDYDGNAYIFTGNIAENPGVADKLLILSPEGEILAEHEVNITTGGSSGAFFMYDTLYLYFGPYMYLVPVLINDSGVEIGDQIPVPKVFIESVTGPNGTFNVYFMAIDADACYRPNLSVNDALALNFTKVYPNPVKDRLYYDSENSIDQIEVYNLSGQKLFTQNTHSKKGELNLQFLPAGTYLLKFLAQGKVTETHKFIKL